MHAPPDVFIDGDGVRYATTCRCPMHNSYPQKGHDARPLRDETAPKDGPDKTLTYTATSATPEAT